MSLVEPLYCPPKPAHAQMPKCVTAFRSTHAIAALLLAACVAFGPCAGEDKRPEAGKPTGEAADEFEGQNVQSIQIHGLSRVDEGTVLRLIRTRMGRPFSRKTWEEDWHRLEDSNYFLSVLITDPQVWPGGVLLVIDLIEKASISKITFKGSNSVGAQRLLDIIKSNEGGRYDKGQVHLDRGAIEKYYRDKAFRSVKVDYEVEVVASHKQLVGEKEVDVEDEVRVIFNVDEGNPVGVRVIHFKGNKIFGDAELKGVLATKERRFYRAGDLKDEDLETDIKRLQAFYLRHGYMDVSVEKTDIQVSKETYFNWFRKRKHLADVEITINEGPQYFTGNVTLTGNTAVEKDEIESVMKVKTGAVFSDVLMEDDKDRIKDLYGERGRIFTRVEANAKLVTDPERTKKTPNIYDVAIVIREGAEITLHEVITRGNTKTRDKVIIRQMELYPGDRIDTAKMKIATQRFKNLNYFEDDIHISPEQSPENPEESDLIIDVTEKNTGEFNFGVGVSSVDSVLGNVRLTQRNFDFRDLPQSWRDFISGNSFVGAGETFSIEATAGTKRQRYNMSFFEPWAFDRPIRLGGSVFRNVDTFTDFEETSTGASATVGRRLWGPRWDGDLTYKISLTDISQIEKRFPPILRSQEGQQLLSSITPRIVYDSRDSRVLPSRGWLMEASMEIAGGPFFGDRSFVKPVLDLSNYMTVFKLKNGGKHILELHGRAAAVEAYGSSDDVPPYLRLYAGGIDSIRGFQYRSITPLENGFQIGGKRMAYATAEYSMPLYEEIVRGSAFVDGGTVFDAGNTDPHTIVTNENGLRASVGLGLAIRTPFSPLPIRIYVSRPLVKNDTDRTKTLDFSFGTRF